MEDNYTTPHSVIPTPSTFLSGHGTLTIDDQLHSTLAGFVRRINKLVTVRAVKPKYAPEVGDIIVGRVLSVADSHWKIEINSTMSATLQLGSIDLPDKSQRRRNAEDELNMRKQYREDQLVCAEVAAVKTDSILLNTRNPRYGLLQEGLLVKAEQCLVKRLKSHFVDLRNGVNCVFGNNGWIWVRCDDQDNENSREKTVRVRNVILGLSLKMRVISPDSVEQSLRRSFELGLDAAQILSEEYLERIVSE